MSRSVSEIRKDFPQISDDFVYFDNAATTFKPQSVIDAMTHFYESKNANVYRSIYDLGEEATELYENARTIVRQFVGADDSYEVVFARNTTEAINLVARGLDYKVVILGGREHHSNLLPWFQNENIVVHQADANNDILRHPKLSTKADILAISAWSNVLGKETRLNEILDNSNDYCRIKLVDAAQWVANEKISMNNIDLLAFSGHKMYGPMGIGVLVAKKGLLEKMRPLYWGGEMVDAAHRTASSDWHNAFIKAQLTDVPQRFEAGTPNVAGAVGLVAAIEWIQKNGYFSDEKIALYEYARNKMREISHINVLPGNDIICFTIDGVHPHDIAQLLNEDKIYVRSGFHCAQPLLEELNYGPVVRVSLACYNTKSEVDRLIATLKKVRKKMGIK